MTSVLDMGPEFCASMQRLRTFAESRANWYFYPSSRLVPGDNPAYVVRSGTIRIVFTWTVAEQAPTFQVFRHLTVSTLLQAGGKPRLPNPTIVFTIACMLGFTGSAPPGEIATAAGSDWQISMNSDDDVPHVALAQEVPDSDVPTPLAATLS